jgi:hypothetical protein
MGLKSYFDRDTRLAVAFAVAGIVVGFLSFLLGTNVGAVLLMIVGAAVVILALRKTMGIKEELRWWFSNGLIVYIIFWFVVWVIFYNIGLR